MNYKEYFKQFENDPEYLKAREELGIIFDIADDVLRLRIEKGWSQAELAERAGTKQANISRLEGGLSNPSINFLQKVAKALDTSISIKLENTPSPKIIATTDTKNQSIHVPNWPVSENFQYYPTASTSEKL